MEMEKLFFTSAVTSSDHPVMKFNVEPVFTYAMTMSDSAVASGLLPHLTSVATSNHSTAGFFEVVSNKQFGSLSIIANFLGKTWSD